MLNKVFKQFGWHIEPMEMDHFVPFSHNGKQTDNNMVCACKTCNRKKSNNKGWKKRNPSIIGKILYWFYPVIEQELKELK